MSEIASDAARGGHNPLRPADLGLPGLGLVMQLGGWVYAWISVAVAGAILFAAPGGGPNRTLAWALAGAIGLGAVRSGVHVTAGRALQRHARDAERLVTRYLLAAAIHTAVTLAVLVVVVKASGPVVVQVVILLAAWPLVVFAIGRSRAVRHYLVASSLSPVPLVEPNAAIQGTAALMTGLGIVALLTSGAFTWLAVRAVSERADLIGVVAIATLVALIIRAGLQVRAGLSGRAGDPNTFYPGVRTYLRVALGSLLLYLTVGALLAAHLRGRIDLAEPAFFFAIGAALLAVWPAILRRAIPTRDLTQVEIEEDGTELRPATWDPEPAPAPDAGMTALGFLLLALGSIAIGSGVGALVNEGGLEFPALPTLAAGEWAQIVAGALAAWSGVEIAWMTPRRRLAAYIGAMGQLAIGIWSIARTFETYGTIGLDYVAPEVYLLSIVSVAVTVSVPVLAAVRVGRSTPGGSPVHT